MTAPNPFLEQAQAPVAQAPVAQAPVAQAPVAQAPVAQAPVAQAPASGGIVGAEGAHVPGGIAVPVAPGGHKITDDLNAKLLVRPLGVTSMKNNYPNEKNPGPTKQVVRADWIVLDGPNVGQVRENSLVIHDALIEELVRVLEGPNTLLAAQLVQKQGSDPLKKPAYVFAAMAPEDYEFAQRVQAHQQW